MSTPTSCDPCTLKKLTKLLLCAIECIPIPGLPHEECIKAGIPCTECILDPGIYPCAHCLIAGATCTIEELTPFACPIALVFCYLDWPECDSLGLATKGVGPRLAAAATPNLESRADDVVAYERDRLRIAFGGLEYFFGDIKWFSAGRSPDFSAWIQAFLLRVNDTSEAGVELSPQEVQELLQLPLPAPLTLDDAKRFLDRWTRTMNYYRAGWFNEDEVPAGNSKEFISRDRFANAQNAAVAVISSYRAEGRTGMTDALVTAQQQTLTALTSGEQSGTCAKIKLRLEQDAVLARDAFRATLELDNNGSSRLENVHVELSIHPESGAADTNLFAVNFEGATTLSAVDGSGILPGNSSGTAKWLLIPTVDAAPTVPTRFFVGGTLSYRLDGNEVSVPLSEVPITVLPSPRLVLQYFHQRDVFADDPFTPVIEPSIPYSLAVMVQNRGFGEAGNFHITSAQPKIVENEKGLLIDFNLIATEVAGQAVSPSLTVAFGDIHPGKISIGRWLFTSSLQGLFTDYKATFEHVDGLGNPRLSLIDEVSIHEMNHLVQAGGVWEDGKPDFLVNDVPDIHDYPDTLYLSDGSTNAVQLVESATPNATPSSDNRQITLSAPMPGGWAYLRVPDPGNGIFRLTRVQRSDGIEIAVHTNVWTTDRTFIGLSRRPISESILHLLDYNSTGSYTLTYEPGPTTPVDTDPPISAVNVLSAASRPHFQVGWNGRDAGPLGQPNSGIAYYDIYVSENNGAFGPWLPQTHLVSATYSGIAGSHYAFYSVATDANGNRESAPSTPDAETTVSITNHAPVISLPTSVTVNEGETLDLPVTVSDPDADQILTLSLMSGAPPGVILNNTTRRLTWATGEGNGPGTNTLTLVVRDNDFESLTATGRVTVVVNEVNSPPAIDAIPDFKINEGRLLTFVVHATDFDLPAQSLEFSLGPDSPAGASIGRASGEFLWTPSDIHGGTTHRITVIVQDSGTPILSATRSFAVVVRDTSPDFILSLGTTNVLVGHGSHVALRLRSGLELSTLNLQVVPSGGGLTNFSLESIASELGGAVLTPEGTNGLRIDLAAGSGQVLPSDSVLANLLFTAPPQDHSSIVSLPVTGLRGSQSDGVVLENGRVTGGRVFVIAGEPLLDSVLAIDSTESLVVYGQPGESYEIQSAISLESPVPWQPVRTIELADTFAIATGLPVKDSQVYYRAVKMALPQAHPVGSVIRLADDRLQVRFEGISERPWIIEGTTNLLDWLPVSTNSPPVQFTLPPDLGLPLRYFRVKGQ